MKRNELSRVCLSGVIALFFVIPVQAVTFYSNITISEGDSTYDGQEIVVSGCILTCDGAHSFTAVSVIDNGIITHTAGSTGLQLNVAGSVTVDYGSRIDVSGRGDGPRVETTGWAGGSYGGRGEYGNGGYSCPTFGDVYLPSDLGTGGRGISSSYARGGGILRIMASTLDLDGSLLANGENGGAKLGSGSGGSILLEVGTLSGFGFVHANGGELSNYGHGGGGRVAIYYDDASSFDLAAVQCAGGADNAGAGTIYLRNRTHQAGELLLDNLGRQHSASFPSVLGLASNLFDRLEVRAGARLELTLDQPLYLAGTVVSGAYATVTGDVVGPDILLDSGEWSHSGIFGYSNAVVLTGSSVLSHGTGYAGGLQINAQSVMVSFNARIDVSGGGDGPRAETTGWAGGSYGGRGSGGNGGYSCPTFGDVYLPLDLGTGGRGISSSYTRGGGLLRITAQELALDGSLLANGANAGVKVGSGSGGSILLEVEILNGSGSIQANGGELSDYGHGGGGRVAIYCADPSGFDLSAVESKAYGSAQWGSVFLGVPRTVNVSITGVGECTPAGPVTIPYEGTNLFSFTSIPASLATNGTSIISAATFEWVNAGLLRGYLDDTAWTELLADGDLLEAAFVALQLADAAMLPGGGMEVSIDGVAGWHYTLQRRTSLIDGDWEPVAGQTDILCIISGPLLLSDTADLPRAFYRIIATP